MLNVEVVRRLEGWDPWKLARTAAHWMFLEWWRRPQRIDLPPMSADWLRAHERESGQHPDW